MRKSHQPVYDPGLFSFAVSVALVMDVPVRLLGIIAIREGRQRSQHRHRNRGRAA